MGHCALSRVWCHVSLVFLIFISGCQPTPSAIQLDESRTAPGEPQRIITLAPHLTELVFSLGAQDRLIATVAYSDYPQAAMDIPRIGDAFRIDWEQLAQLKPDLILAWQNGNPQIMLDEIRRKKFPLHAFDNPKLFDLPEQLHELAALIGTNGITNEIAENYLNGLQALQTHYANKNEIRVFYQIASEPLFTIDGDHVISEMLTVCGAQNVFGAIGKIAAPVSVEAVLAVKPDVILTTNEMRDSVVEVWSQTGLMDATNILSVSPDEVARASLRMLQGTRNICETLDGWRERNRH